MFFYYTMLESKVTIQHNQIVVEDWNYAHCVCKFILQHDSVICFWKQVSLKEASNCKDRNPSFQNKKCEQVFINFVVSRLWYSIQLGREAQNKEGTESGPD